MSFINPRTVAPSFRFIKKGCASPMTTAWVPGRDDKVVNIVSNMLAEIETQGETAAEKYAVKFDKWPQGKPFLVSREEVEQQTSVLPDQVKSDIKWQMHRIKRFAQAQRNSINDFEMDIADGVTAGQKLVPMETVGCYIPGGRFSHVSSALMTIATAKVAGVENIVACSPPLRGTAAIHPATLYAMYLAGADYILVMGGVQAIASMAFGLFTGKPADKLVGPGNSFVAEAKRQLFGRCGIDLFAGPTEIAVIADSTADPFIVATDLISQAEHGTNSPAWCICTDENIAKQVAIASEECAAKLLRDHPGSAAVQSWKDYGEIVVVDSREEAVKVSDLYAAEHLEVHCTDLRWWLDNLKNYGSLFLGEETCVTYGDKTSGPNHVLPTKCAARYTGGLSVHAYLKVLTWQTMERDDAEVAVKSARISRTEGMEGHARSSDVRLQKYFPGKVFDVYAKL